MFLLASQIGQAPILSLQNGHAVAQAGDMLMDPDKLEVAAIFCRSGNWRKDDHVLLLRDIREFSRAGIIVDSLEDIEDIGEIVRLSSLVEKKYELVGKPAITENGTKLGKIDDYTIDTVSNKVQKIYVKPSLLKNLLVNNLVIDRSQIVRAEANAVIVSDAALKTPAKPRLSMPTQAEPQPKTAATPSSTSKE